MIKKLVLLQYESVIQKNQKQMEIERNLKEKLVVALKTYQHFMQNTTINVTKSTYQKNAQNQDLNRSIILLFNSSQIIYIHY